MSALAKLLTVGILAIIDIINYIWGDHILGTHFNEVTVGVIVTILLGVVGMIGVAVPQRSTP